MSLMMPCPGFRPPLLHLWSYPYRTTSSWINWSKCLCRIRLTKLSCNRSSLPHRITLVSPANHTCFTSTTKFGYPPAMISLRYSWTSFTKHLLAGIWVSPRHSIAFNNIFHGHICVPMSAIMLLSAPPAPRLNPKLASLPVSCSPYHNPRHFGLTFPWTSLQASLRLTGTQQSWLLSIDSPKVPTLVLYRHTIQPTRLFCYSSTWSAKSMASHAASSPIETSFSSVHSGVNYSGSVVPSSALVRLTILSRMVR